VFRSKHFFFRRPRPRKTGRLQAFSKMIVVS
jgi:hypothetical protein